MKANTEDAYKLFHDGTIMLAEMEHNGIRVDELYLAKAIKETDDKVRKLTGKLMNDPIYHAWRKKYGAKTNLYSLPQLGDILFNELGYECLERTEKKGAPKVNEAALSQIDEPFVINYRTMVKLKGKVRNTYLEGIRREVCEGYIHPSFNLTGIGDDEDERGGPSSYRSASTDPNFQNIPIRDPIIAEIIRQCFIPRKGRRIIEIDYGGIEVKIAACYHKDPTMIRYIEDPHSDMHRDMAMACYMLAETDVSKLSRYCAKNQFVFPQFYGDYYINCAKALWASIDKMGLKAGEVPMKEHLAKKGIKGLGKCDPKHKPRPGTFEHHIQKVEEHFWNVRFPVYNSWKRSWWKKYQTHAGFDTLTGFHIEGVYTKNQVINIPVQGSAFHCLLQSLIWIQKEIKRQKMKTLLIGQIHDSGLADSPEDEYEDFVAMATEIMTERLRKEWPWIIVPLEVEAEVTPRNGSWFTKKPYAAAS